MTKYTNTFIQEFSLPLDEIQRPWLRRSITLLLAPFGFITVAVSEGYIQTRGFIKECW